MEAAGGYYHDPIDPKEYDKVKSRLDRFERLLSAAGTTLEQAESDLNDRLTEQAQMNKKDQSQAFHHKLQEE